MTFLTFHSVNAITNNKTLRDKMTKYTTKQSSITQHLSASVFLKIIVHSHLKI